MASFTFVTPSTVVCGWGAATDGRLAAEAAKRGRRPLIVCGRSLRVSGALDAIVRSLADTGAAVIIHEGVPPEPSLDDVRSAITAASGADCIVAVGGGSALDVAKAAALAPLGIDISSYFDGATAVPDSGALPIIAAPTTAGTGSEATWVGVYTDKKAKRKASIRGGALLPSSVILDANLTLTCPATVTAHSGLDALVQALESYISSGANPLTDALAFDAAVLVGKNLAHAVAEPTDRDAREAMLLGSYMAGVALNTSRLGLVHGLAHPLGALTSAPHGLLCGLLLPPVLRFNRDASGHKLARVADALGWGGADDLIGHVEQLLLRFDVPTRLAPLGVAETDLDSLAADAMTSGSTRANPRPVTIADARRVLEEALGR